MSDKKNFVDGSRTSAEVREKREFVIESGGASRTGYKHELQAMPSEDHYIVDPHRRLFAVADGMGGALNGGADAEAALRFLTQETDSAETEIARNAFPSPVQRMQLAIDQVNERLHSEPLPPTMDPVQERRAFHATTLTSLKFFNEGEVGQKAIIGHVGDSRVYRLRGGTVDILTTDMNVVHAPRALKNMLVKNNRFPSGAEEEFDQKLTTESGRQALMRKFDTVKSKDELTPLEYEIYGLLHLIYSNIGLPRKQFESAVFEIDVVPGDQFVIASDGLSNLTPEQIGHILEVRNTASAEDVARTLVSGAYTLSQLPNEKLLRAKPDDITAVVVRVK